jgi:hypothetical protein
MTFFVKTHDELGVCLSTNELEMGHAYQKMIMENFGCMFLYGLNYLRKICVQDYVNAF